jgi:hypothetical protein
MFWVIISNAVKQDTKSQNQISPLDMNLNANSIRKILGTNIFFKSELRTQQIACVVYPLVYRFSKAACQPILLHISSFSLSYSRHV